MRPFGPSKTEIWRQLSAELGGTLTSTWRGEKVQVEHEHWVVTLDTFVVMAVKSNNEPRVRELLRDGTLRRRLEEQPALALSVKDDEGWFGTKFPEHVDELYLSVHGVIKDVERLKDLFELFAVTLDRLVMTGSAVPIAPVVQL